MSTMAQSAETHAGDAAWVVALIWHNFVNVGDT